MATSNTATTNAYPQANPHSAPPTAATPSVTTSSPRPRPMLRRQRGHYDLPTLVAAETAAIGGGADNPHVPHVALSPTAADHDRQPYPSTPPAPNHRGRSRRRRRRDSPRASPDARYFPRHTGIITPPPGDDPDDFPAALRPRNLTDLMNDAVDAVVRDELTPLAQVAGATTSTGGVDATTSGRLPPTVPRRRRLRLSSRARRRAGTWDPVSIPEYGAYDVTPAASLLCPWPEACHGGRGGGDGTAWDSDDEGEAPEQTWRSSLHGSWSACKAGATVFRWDL